MLPEAQDNIVDCHSVGNILIGSSIYLGAINSGYRSLHKSWEADRIGHSSEFAQN